MSVSRALTVAVLTGLLILNLFGLSGAVGTGIPHEGSVALDGVYHFESVFSISSKNRLHASSP